MENCECRSGVPPFSNSTQYYNQANTVRPNRIILDSKAKAPEKRRLLPFRVVYMKFQDIIYNVFSMFVLYTTDMYKR